MPWGEQCIGEGGNRACFKVWEPGGPDIGPPAQQVTRYKTERRCSGSGRFRRCRDVQVPVLAQATDPWHAGLPQQIYDMRPKRYKAGKSGRGGSYPTMGPDFAWGLVSAGQMTRLRSEGPRVMLDIESQVAKDIFDAMRGASGPDERRSVTTTSEYHSDYRRALQIAVEDWIERTDFERRKGAEQIHLGLLLEEQELASQAELEASQAELEELQADRERIAGQVAEAEEARAAAGAEYAAFVGEERRLSALGLRTPYGLVGTPPGISRPRRYVDKRLGAGDDLGGGYNALRLASQSYLGG